MTASSTPSGCRGPSRRENARGGGRCLRPLLEREPERSIYNRICAIEWNGPVGEVATCGGNFVIRAESFRKVGGFNPTIIAAEDDDLCLRVRRDGGQILRLDAPMAWHDAAMTRIGQWWKRAVRSGYAYAQVSAIHGRGPYRHFVREARSAWFWGVGVPVAIAALAFVTRGWALVLLPVLYFVAAFRITRNNRCAACRRRWDGFTRGTVLAVSSRRWSDKLNSGGAARRAPT